MRSGQLPDGRVADFEIKHEGPSVCVLALTATQNVILAQQFRPGPEAMLLELPGGGIDPNESPLEAAQRDLLEETGYRGDSQARISTARTRPPSAIPLSQPPVFPYKRHNGAIANLLPLSNCRLPNSDRWYEVGGSPM